PERIELVNGKERLEIGPGEGGQLTLQLSRSAGWSERGFFARLIDSAPRKVTWLNVRLRGRGLSPIYLRAELPDDQPLVGVPVLPGLATDIDYDDLCDLLVCCLALDVGIASWEWDETTDIHVSENVLDEVQSILGEPQWSHWQMLCDWYEALPSDTATRVLPRLRAELSSWPVALRQVEADLDTVNLDRLLAPTHSHLDISAVLRVLPFDSAEMSSASLDALKTSSRFRHLHTLVFHAPADMVGSEFWIEVAQADTLPELKHLALHGSPLGRRDW